MWVAPSKRSSTTIPDVYKRQHTHTLTYSTNNLHKFLVLTYEIKWTFGKLVQCQIENQLFTNYKQLYIILNHLLIFKLLEEMFNISY